MKVGLKYIGLLALVCIPVYLILRYIPVEYTPFLYVYLFLFVLLFSEIFITKRNIEFKATLLILSAFVLFFAGVEMYYAEWFTLGMNRTKFKNNHHEGSYFTPDNHYWIPDDILGYAGGKNASATAKVSRGNKIIYNVKYTLNNQGLRISPHDLLPIQVPSVHKNVAFFGCSFTLGEGVNDNETLPYQMEELSHGTYQTFNLGFHGYGPHQMLRGLETGLFDTLLKENKPDVFVYQALMGHIERVAGNYPYILWDVKGPKYTLLPNGEIQYTGNFESQWNSKLANWFLLKGLHKSWMFQKVLESHILGRKRLKKDTQLFVKLIIQSNTLFTQKYHGKFYVILWTDNNNKDQEFIISELNKHNIPVITTNEILGKENDPFDKFHIPYDGHPSPLAYQTIAQYLLNMKNQ